MKALFLVLCLLNIGLLLWEFRNGAFVPPAEESALPSILLAEEQVKARNGAAISVAIDQVVTDWERSGFKASRDKLQTESRPRQPMAKPVVPAATPKQVEPAQTVKAVPVPGEAAKAVVSPQACYEIGPFADENALKQWLSGKALGKTETIYKDVETAGDFQVYYPAAKTPEQARINKMMLNAKGITDIWPVPSGDNKGALSLGVFADRVRANNFKAQLAQQGVQAEVKQRAKVQRQVYAKALLDKRQFQQWSAQASRVAPCQ